MPGVEIEAALLRQEVGQLRTELAELKRALDELNGDLKIIQIDRQAAIEKEKAYSASITELRADMKTLMEMATRWKGGILVLAALGGIVGWVLSVWDKVTKPWH